MEATTNYGPVKAGQYYKMLDSENDWVLLRVSGTPIYVPV